MHLADFLALVATFGASTAPPPHNRGASHSSTDACGLTDTASELRLEKAGRTSRA
jgi:hypothetical protein